jgi:hypothetical protein
MFFESDAARLGGRYAWPSLPVTLHILDFGFWILDSQERGSSNL